MAGGIHIVIKASAWTSRRGRAFDGYIAPAETGARPVAGCCVFPGRVHPRRLTDGLLLHLELAPFCSKWAITTSPSGSPRQENRLPGAVPPPLAPDFTNRDFFYNISATSDTDGQGRQGSVKNLQDVRCDWVTDMTLTSLRVHFAACPSGV